MLIKRNDRYLDIRNIKRSTDMGVRLVKIPYKRSVMLLAGGIVLIAMITPFTNFILVPLASWIFRRYA